MAAAPVSRGCAVGTYRIVGTHRERRSTQREHFGPCALCVAARIDRACDCGNGKAKHGTAERSETAHWNGIEWDGMGRNGTRSRSAESRKPFVDSARRGDGPRALVRYSAHAQATAYCGLLHSVHTDSNGYAFTASREHWLDRCGRTYPPRSTSTCTWWRAIAAAESMMLRWWHGTILMRPSHVNRCWIGEPTLTSFSAKSTGCTAPHRIAWSTATVGCKRSHSGAPAQLMQHTQRPTGKQHNNIKHATANRKATYNIKHATCNGQPESNIQHATRFRRRTPVTCGRASGRT